MDKVDRGCAEETHCLPAERTAGRGQGPSPQFYVVSVVSSTR